MRGRPELYTNYESEAALFNTPAKKMWMLAFLVVLVMLPFRLKPELTFQLATTFVVAIGVIGLNLVTGYAGQVSLGHAFFIGLGAYTAAVLDGPRDATTLGFDQDMLVWLPASGLVAAVAGLIVSPLAFRLKGLYLAIVTLGLVFIGEHFFREAESVTGGSGVGRGAAVPEMLGFSFDAPPWGLTRFQGLYFMGLLFLIVLALLARNLARSGVGRAFASIRDRDIAAEVMGVSLKRYKALAFTISSFYAGVAGALYFTLTGYIEPGSFNLLLSVQFIAMVLIGGVATISGSIMGAAFITLLPRFVQEVPRFVPFVGSEASSGVLSVQQLEQVLYGLLIVIFVIFEPRGLYGLWVRIRNYWKSWPFSY